MSDSGGQDGERQTLAGDIGLPGEEADGVVGGHAWPDSTRRRRPSNRTDATGMGPPAPSLAEVTKNRLMNR